MPGTMFYMRFLLILWVGEAYASRIDALDKYTVVKHDETTGHVYIADGAYVRVFDEDMTEIRTFNLSDDVQGNSEVNILEIINRNGSTYLFVCLYRDNLTCYWIDIVSEMPHPLSLPDDIEYRLSLTDTSAPKVRNTTITSVVCDPTLEYVPNVVFICLAFGNSCNNPNTESIVEVLEVSVEAKAVSFIPTSRDCQWNTTHPRVFNYKIVTSFRYNNNAFLVIVTDQSNTTTQYQSSKRKRSLVGNYIDQSAMILIHIRHVHPGDVTQVIVPMSGGAQFPIFESVAMFQHNAFKDHLAVLTRNNQYYMAQHVSMQSVVRYTQLATRNGIIDLQRNETNNITDILRSTSVLNLEMAPWQFPVSASPIDVMKVSTRLGSVVAYHTSKITDEDRTFNRIKLGANSNSLQWKENIRFGKQQLIDMWANGRYLYVAGEKQIIKFDTAACQHNTISDCNHDIECTWCGEIPGDCKQRDACASPWAVDKMVKFAVRGIQPHEGFTCGGSVVRIEGRDLDLTNNITVKVNDVTCDVIRDMSTKTSIEVRIPAYTSPANSTLTVQLPDGKEQGFPFTYLKCPHIIEPGDHIIKTIKSGGTRLQVSVGNIEGLNNAYFYQIEVAFLYNNSVVATTRLRHVEKDSINSFEFFFPPLIDYVGKHLRLALAAPTYHLLDRPRPVTVLYGSISNLNVYVEEDPIILGIHVGVKTTDILTVPHEAKSGKIYFTGKNLETVSETDIEVLVEHLGPCRNVSIMRSNNRVSCDLPWVTRFMGKTCSRDIIVYIGSNLIYHPGEVKYRKSDIQPPVTWPPSTSGKTAVTSDQINTRPMLTFGLSKSEDSSAIPLEILIPCLMVACGFLVCIFMYCRFRKKQRRRDLPDREFPSVVSYRSNHGVFIGDGRPSFSFQGASVDNTSMDAFINDNYEESAHLIISTMEEEGLILKKRDLNIDQLIGRGNFGSVYKGHQCVGGERRDIAVKTLQRDKPENMDITQFLKEAFVMKNFRHPNVMTLVGVCLDAGDMPLVVLPYMKHGDLLTYLQEERHIPTVKDLVCFGLDIALGMEYLASLKFVHRDLAARNCMLDVNFRVKVADFGLSRDVYETSYYSTRSKGVKLPVKWMSIESLSGGVFNEKTDVWSYGVTLWELMTRGVRPYAAVDNWDMEAYLKSGRRLPQPIYCPANFYKLMRKCWSADPDDRPSFTIVKDWISELLNRVHHYLGDMDQTTNIEKTYVNLSMGNQCKYENLGNF